ncbi:MAG: peptidoglycan endopeptidase [Pontixanthobacter sp.]
MRPQRVAEAARALVGAPFKLYGRSHDTGIDCVGVALHALAAVGLPIPKLPPYRLRNRDPATLIERVAPNGLLRDAPGPVVAGDIVVVRPGPGQAHCMVAVPYAAFVHAHAGLGRVVLMPAPGPWPIATIFRIHP